jgi:hypothetical protein
VLQAFEMPFVMRDSAHPGASVMIAALRPKRSANSVTAPAGQVSVEPTRKRARLIGALDGFNGLFKTPCAQRRRIGRWRLRGSPTFLVCAPSSWCEGARLRFKSIAQTARWSVLSALVPASIASSMKDEIFQAASNTLKIVAVRRRKWNLR